MTDSDVGLHRVKKRTEFGNEYDNTVDGSTEEEREVVSCKIPDRSPEWTGVSDETDGGSRLEDEGTDTVSNRARDLSVDFYHSKTSTHVDLKDLF